MKDILFEFNASAFYNGSMSLSDILEEYTMQSQFVYNRPENMLLIGIYIPVFLLALLANLLVIAVFVKYRSFRTVTNCFLLNLSLADLLVTVICMPAAIGQAVHSAWIYGSLICKLNHYLQGVAVGASVFTLTAMSIDRYLAIRHPLKRKNCVSKILTMKIICLIWIVSILIFLPILYVRKTDGFRIHNYDFVFCLEKWESPANQRAFGSLVFLLVFLIPGLTLICAYSLMGCTLRQAHLLPAIEIQTQAVRTTTSNSSNRSFQAYTISTINLMKERRKVARTLMILGLVFALCWLPSSVLGVILDYFDPSEESKPSSTSTSTSSSESEGYDMYVTFHKYFIWIGHLNSLLNPLLYSLLTRNFRNHVKDWAKSICSPGSPRGTLRGSVRMRTGI